MSSESDKNTPAVPPPAPTAVVGFAAKANSGPTAPTLGAAVGAAVGVALGEVLHLGPVLGGILTTVLSAAVSGALHVLFTELGIPDPFV